MEAVVFEEPAFAGSDFVMGLTTARVCFVIDDLSTFRVLLDEFCGRHRHLNRHQNRKERKWRHYRRDLTLQFDFFAGM
jgi:hypothetical protein